MAKRIATATPVEEVYSWLNVFTKQYLTYRNEVKAARSEARESGNQPLIAALDQAMDACIMIAEAKEDLRKYSRAPVFASRKRST